MARYDVALWRQWPTLFPDAVMTPAAFAAIETVMRLWRYRWVAYASAWASNGSLIYRGYRVRLHTAIQPSCPQEGGDAAGELRQESEKDR